MLKKSTIIGCGSFLPPKIITNQELSKSLETSDEWIISRSGIAQRHIAEPNVVTSDLGAAAALNALNHAGRSPDEIDLIIVATTTPDRTFPATAAYIQNKIGAKVGGAAFDVQAVCSGFVYALSTASALVEKGQAKTALVIGAELMSRIIDWEDRTTAVLFGDGAGAVIVEQCDSKSESYIIDHHLACDGAQSELLYVDGGPAYNQQVGHLRMKGKEVFRHAVENISHTVETLLKRNNLSVGDIDWFVPHQANERIIKAVAQRIGMPEEKTVITVTHHANTSAASIPLAFDMAVKDGRIQKGQLVMTEAMGGGFTWGGNLFRY